MLSGTQPWKRRESSIMSLLFINISYIQLKLINSIISMLDTQRLILHHLNYTIL